MPKPDELALGRGRRDGAGLGLEIRARTQTLGRHGSTVNCVAFSQDGQWIAAGNSDSLVRIWDQASGEERLTLRGHRGSVLSLAFNPDNRRLISSGGDTTVKIWDATASREVFTLRGLVAEGPVRGIALPERRGAASITATGAVHVWDTALAAPTLSYMHNAGVLRARRFRPTAARSPRAARTRPFASRTPRPVKIATPH